MGCNSSQGRHCGESIIKDDVKLGLDVLGVWIQDKRNGRRVIERKPNKNPLVSTTISFWDLFSILKPRIENIHQAAKDMGMGKVGSRTFDTRPQFLQREAITMGGSLL